MNFENIGLQGNHDALMLINDMIHEDQRSWTGFYNRMWPHQREVAVMALCRMAVANTVAQASDEQQAKRIVLAQLSEFGQAIDVQLKLRGTRS